MPLYLPFSPSLPLSPLIVIPSYSSMKYFTQFPHQTHNFPSPFSLSVSLKCPLIISPDFEEPLCWSQPNMEPNPTSSLSSKPNSSLPFWIPKPDQQIPKQPMFEKPLTPSDVGKLNRLVIPKQHAEKYLPPVGESDDNKGLLLSFEDELGKCWRFRYSYWSSSQSYVLTKGWSRYVKEKQLDAGDVVLFERHSTDGERLFIGWRRRRGDNSSGGGVVMVQGNSSGNWSRGLYSSSAQHQPYQHHPHGANLTTRVPYQHECLHAGGQSQTIPIGNSKRLRLFGVNLECQLDETTEPWTPDGSSMATQDVSFSLDGNQMRNGRG